MKILNSFIVQLIKLYQILLSPDHSFWARALGKHFCRYHPTCSEYGKICFERFGFFRATWLTIRRILRCNPWSKWGLDLPPEKK